MRRKVIPILMLLIIMAIGAFFRLNNLDNNVIWDSDTSLYSIYSRKYYEIIELVKSDQFRSLWKAKKEGSDYVNIEAFARDLRQDPQYKKLLEGVETTTRVFPDWVCKPAFILTAALFRFFNNRDNSLLTMTALFGTLIIPLSFWLFYRTGQKLFEAVIATLLIAFSPMLVGYSRIGYSQIVALFFLIPFFYFYYKSAKTDSRGPLVASGAFLGLAQANHPIVLLWVFFAICHEVILHINKPKLLFSRLSFLTLGYIPILLLLEILHLYLWHFSLLFAGAPIRSYLHMLFFHSQSRPIYPYDPLFYIKSISLYEGIIFFCALAFSIYFPIRRKEEWLQNRFWLFFTLFPLLFLSILSWHIFPTLRNIPFILVPAYILISNSIVSRLRGKLLIITLFFAVIHLCYSAKANWSNAHYSVPTDEIKLFIEQHPDKTLIASRGDLFLSNVLHTLISDRPSKKEGNLFFYREIGGYEGNAKVVKSFSTDAFDKRMFLLEDPGRLPLFFDKAGRQLYNKIYFTFEEF